MIEIKKSEIYSIMDVSTVRAGGSILATGETEKDAVEKFIKEVEVARKQSINNIEVFNKLISESKDYLKQICIN